jgi:Tol biopolymer transport system component
MENEVRELLRGIAEDLPPHREVPRTLRPRARRRIAATVGIAVVVVGALTLGGLAVVHATIEFSLRPAVPGPTNEPTPLAAGEVLTVMSGDLVAEDPDSGEVRTIVDAKTLPPRHGTPKQITGAAWSPDRRWVAFRANGLFVAHAVGGAPRQLTEDQGWSPWAWSPTKDQLAIVEGRDVTLVDVATGRETHLGTAVGAEDSEGNAVHALVWSPDGTRIAYDGGPGWGSVYSIDVDSGKHALLVRQPAGTRAVTDIDWSPDGTHLAITYEEASQDGDALYLANADGSHVRLVAHIAPHPHTASQWGVWQPGMSVGTAWSPDGTRLAYTSLSGRDHPELQVWTFSVDGSAPSLVASRCCAVEWAHPVWSPDGSQVAFGTLDSSLTPGDDPRYLVVNADGTGDAREIDGLIYQSWAGGWTFCFCYG